MNELGSCLSNVCHSCGYELLQKSKDSLKAWFENVNIYKYRDLKKALLKEIE